jgi:outer membrane protein assembly factor BamB
MNFRLLILILASVAPVALADDYPQWLGPQRDNVYREAGIVESFPAEGLKVTWRAPVGGGYAQVAVSDAGRVIVTDRVAAKGGGRPADPNRPAVLPGVERILCLDDTTGRELWRVEYDCPYSVSYAAGPRTTPAIDGNRVFTLGAEGDVHCLDLQTGKVVWKKRLGGKTPIWGFAASPLVEGDRLILLSSGRPLLTALDKRTGDVLWGALEADDPGYAPPTPMTLAGRRQIVQYHPKGVAGIDPTDGRVLWELPYGPEQNGVTIVTPVQLSSDTFALASAWNGMAAIRVSGPAGGGGGGDRAEILWRAKSKGRAVSALHPIHSQIVPHDGRVYGVDGSGALACVDPADGHVVWKDTKPLVGDHGDRIQWGTGFLTAWQPDADRPARHFFLATDGGDLILCDLSAQGYRELSRTHVLDPTNRDPGRPALWCHPTYAHQSVYWRNDNEVIRASLAK